MKCCPVIWRLFLKTIYKDPIIFHNQDDSMKSLWNKKPMVRGTPESVRHTCWKKDSLHMLDTHVGICWTHMFFVHMFCWLTSCRPWWTRPNFPRRVALLWHGKKSCQLPCGQEMTRQRRTPCGGRRVPREDGGLDGSVLGPKGSKICALGKPFI